MSTKGSRPSSPVWDCAQISFALSLHLPDHRLLTAHYLRTLHIMQIQSFVAILVLLIINCDAVSTAFNRPTKIRPPTGVNVEWQAPPSVTFKAGTLITLFAADKKTFLIAGHANCPSEEIFENKQIAVNGPMPRYGPRYLCTYKSSLFVLISESKVSDYYCTSLASQAGCVRKSFWWSVWYKWSTVLSSLGIDYDDIRYNRQVTLSAKQYAYLVRLFWKIFHNGSLPVESTIVHSIHGHSMPSTYLRAPVVSRGGGAFGAPVWHADEDPCVKDTLDILYRWKNIIPRPCKPIAYDGSGFYVDPSTLLSSTALAGCNHDCGFRYYYGNTERGQIVAFRTNTLKLKSKQSIEGAILDHS